MPNDANTLGVTPSVLASFVANLTITAASSPNTDDVALIIQTEADSLRGFCAGRGITYDSLTDADEQYGTLRGILIKLSLAAVMRAKLRGADAEGFAREASYELKRLRENPQSIQLGNTADSATTVADYRAETATSAPAWHGSPAGRIVTGGSL